MYQQEGPINTVSNVGPLEVVQGLQRLSDKTPSMVLDSWNSLTQQEKLEIENPSSDWLNSVKKAKKDLNHIDIVSLITRSGGHFSMIMTLFDFFISGSAPFDFCYSERFLFDHCFYRLIWLQNATGRFRLQGNASNLKPPIQYFILANQ